MFVILLMLLPADSNYSNVPRGMPSAALLSAVTYTTADVVLYVDPTGSDSNACTASGTAACLTIQGALNKTAKMLRHRVTVNVAAGNYAGFLVSGFTFDASTQKTTAGLLINGTLGNVTPTTGSATGTATGGTAGSGITFGTLVQAGAGWTVDDFRGKLVNITAGTGSGAVRVITTNTADTLTIAGAWTAPTGTSVFAIIGPTSVITSTTAAIPQPVSGSMLAAAGFQITGNNGPQVGAIQIWNMGISLGSSAAFNITGPIGIILQQDLFTAGLGTVTANAVVTSTSTAYSAASIPLTVTNGGQLTVTQSLLVDSNGGGVSVTSGRLAVSSTQINVAGGAASPGGITGSAEGSVNITSVRCDCASAANSACLASSGGNGAATISPMRPSTMQFNTAVNVTNCTYGLAAGPNSSIVGNTGVLSGNALAYSVMSSWGGSIYLSASTATITSGTADMAIDNGANTGAFASLLASYDCLAGLGTTSRICRF